MREKYLRLENTEECLRLAECLINSTHLSEICRGRLIGRTESLFAIQVDSQRIERFYELSIPLSDLRLNPFKCCENSIPVIIDRGHWGKEKRSKSSTMLNILATGGVTFELDLERLPNGASIAEVDNGKS